MADRISELPHELKEHILSFVPTRDAIRSCILSKNWRQTWLMVPYLDFSKAFFDQHWKCADISMILEDRTVGYPSHDSKYFTFIEKALIKPTHTFCKLQLFLPASKKLDTNIVYCINRLSVNDLSLIISGPLLDTYYPPKCILTTTSITQLYFYGLGLVSTHGDVINLPSLRDIEFNSVLIDEKMVENLFSNCPTIETIGFFSCKGFKILRIVGPKLTQFEGEFGLEVQRVEIDAPNLHSLDYQPYMMAATTALIVSPSISLTRLGLRYWDGAFEWVKLHFKQVSQLKELCVAVGDSHVLKQKNHWWGTLIEKLCIFSETSVVEFDISSWENLTSIQLDGPLSFDWLNGLTLFPHLQVLQISSQDTPISVSISSNSLRHVDLAMECTKLKEIKVDCPELTQFTYTTFTIPSISFDAKLQLQCVNFKIPDYDMIEYLSYIQHSKLNLKYSEFVCLHARTLEEIIFKEEMRKFNEPSLCKFEKVKVFIREAMTCEDIATCVDSLLWIYPRVKSIHLIDHTLLPSLKSQNEIHIKFEYIETTELDKCCGCYDKVIQKTCWRHCLKNYSIINWCGIEDERRLQTILDRAILDTRQLEEQARAQLNPQ